MSPELYPSWLIDLSSNLLQMQTYLFRFGSIQNGVYLYEIIIDFIDGTIE